MNCEKFLTPDYSSLTFRAAELTLLLWLLFRFSNGSGGGEKRMAKKKKAKPKKTILPQPVKK